MVAQFVAIHTGTTASGSERTFLRASLARLIVYSVSGRNQDLARAEISSRREATRATQKRSKLALNAFFS
jgi:hypothetical protein